MKLVMRIEASSHINAREQRLQLDDKKRHFRQKEKGKPTREPCKFCGLMNHSMEQCYKNPKNAATLPVRDGVKEDQKNPLQCYICDKVGHTAPRCPDVEKRQQNRNATARKSSLKNENKDGYPTEINGKN